MSLLKDTKEVFKLLKNQASQSLLKSPTVPHYILDKINGNILTRTHPTILILPSTDAFYFTFHVSAL